MTNRERFNQEVSNEELARMLIRLMPSSSSFDVCFPFNQYGFDDYNMYGVWDIDQAIDEYADWLGEEC